MKPPRSPMKVRFVDREESDTQKAREPMLNGLVIARDPLYRFDAVLLRDGERLARFAMQGVPSADSLRVFSIPDAEHALLLTNGFYYYLDLGKGRLAAQGRV